MWIHIHVGLDSLCTVLPPTVAELFLYITYMIIKGFTKGFLLILLWVCTNVYWITSTSGYTFMRKLKNGQRQWLFSLAMLFILSSYLFQVVYTIHDVLLTADIVIYYCRTPELLWMNKLLFFLFSFLCTQPSLSIQRASMLLRDYQ